MYELLRNTEGLGKQIKQAGSGHLSSGWKPHQSSHGRAYRHAISAALPGFKVSERVKTGGDLHSLDNVMNYFRTESDRIIGVSFQHPKDQLAAREIFQSLFKEFGSILGCCLEYVNIEHITKCPVQQEQRPRYVPTGLDNVVDDLIQNMDKAQLQTGKPVGQIQWTPAPMKSVGCLDGSLYNADHIICTLPLGVLKSFGAFCFDPRCRWTRCWLSRNLGLWQSPQDISLLQEAILVAKGKLRHGTF
nr:Cs [Drosophila melanogaster]